MRPSQIVQALKIALSANQPVFLHGSPGVGKSQLVRQVADELKIEFRDLRLSQLDPVDLRGVPSVKNGRTSWNVPDFLPSEGSGILFLDELNSAAQATQAAGYQLVLDRRLGDYVLPEGWKIVAAGNRLTDRAIVNQMATPLRNRFFHINFDCNNEDWTAWALKAGIDVSVISFLRWRPSLLNEFETAGGKRKEENDRLQRLKDAQAFATPRSWEFLSNMVKRSIPLEIEHEVFSGIVGEGPAAEFVGFMKVYRDVPDMDDLIAKPKTAVVPEEPATLYAIATGLAAKATKDNLVQVMTYVKRIPKEFQVLTVKDMVARLNNAFINSKPFSEWISENEALLF